MSDLATLLFANEAFYLVFRGRDMAGMERLWSGRGEVSCIHPGWGALQGRDEVLASWRDILGNPGAPRIACRGARGHVLGDLGLVTCYERIGEDILVATNVFVREAGAWKLLHHQAGPCRAVPAEVAEEPPPAGRVQ